MCKNGITPFYLPPTYEPYLPLLPSRKASQPFGWYSLRLPRKGWPGWVDLGVWSHTEINGRHWELNPNTVTHPSTSRGRRRWTSLIETNARPLHQTTTNTVGLERHGRHVREREGQSLPGNGRKIHPCRPLLKQNSSWNIRHHCWWQSINDCGCFYMDCNGIRTFAPGHSPSLSLFKRRNNLLIDQLPNLFINSFDTPLKYVM